MMHKGLIAVLGIIVAASPVAASQPDLTPATGAPPGTPATRYCLRVEPSPAAASRRSNAGPANEWADQGVDVDKEWAKEGVRVLADARSIGLMRCAASRS